MRIKVLLLTIFTVLTVFPMHSYANENWQEFRDEDGVFNALVPKDYRINKKMIRIDDDKVALTTELTATIDQRPYTNVVKQYIIKYEQTIGAYISDNDVGMLISADVKKYSDYYKGIGGVLRKQRNGIFSGYPGTEILISYEDEELGLQSLRARLIYTQTSRLEQIAIGPDDSMFNYNTDRFFDTLYVHGGRTRLPGKFTEEWMPLSPPSELFTILTPQPELPYVPYKPVIKAGAKREKVSTVFKDPVYNQTLFYNIYSYRFSNNLTMENVQLVLHKNHLMKYRANPASVSYGKSQVETETGLKANLMTTSVTLPASKKAPYINTLKMNIYYYGPFMMVQELIGNATHVQSNFGNTLMSLISFEPKRAIEALKNRRFQEKLGDLRKEEGDDEDMDSIDGDN